MDKDMVIELVASVITIGVFLTVGYVGFKLLAGILRFLNLPESSSNEFLNGSDEHKHRMASELAQRQLEEDMRRLNEDMARNEEDLRRHMDDHHNHMNDHHHHHHF